MLCSVASDLGLPCLPVTLFGVSSQNGSESWFGSSNVTTNVSRINLQSAVKANWSKGHSIVFTDRIRLGISCKLSARYKGVSVNNQPIPFPMDRDGHDFHALFQYMFYTWVQNCTHIESFFNKILNVKHG